MSKTFEIIEIVGVSTVSLSEAIKSAILEANSDKTVSWFNVVEERGRVTPEGDIEYQATLKIGRKLS